MAIPSGYTALDFVGFTDKGTYNSSATYVRNDLVHYAGNIMKCLIDNTIGVTPVEGANWTLWVGASANLVERIVAPLENNPADVAYGVGRQIIYDDWMWEVVKPIAIGDSLIDVSVDPTNGNIKKSDPVETQLLAVKAEADATDAMIAPVETSPATAAHALGTQLIYNNVLYTVTVAIAANDPLATSGAGANITPSANLAAQIAAKANSTSLAAVATSGAYNDLSGKPTLGTAAAKNSTNAVTNGSSDLVESGAVYSQTNALATSIATAEGNIAPVESGTNVSQNYAIGEKFIKEDVLYKAKVALTSGTAWSSLTLNTDYEVADTVTSEIEALTNNKADKADVEALELGEINIIVFSIISLIPVRLYINFT